MREPTYRIKPLEWQVSKYGSVHRAGIEDYWEYRVSGFGRSAFMWQSPTMGWTPCESIDHGKKLAEQHWRERLLPCLELVTDNNNPTEGSK